LVCHNIFVPETFGEEPQKDGRGSSLGQESIVRDPRGTLADRFNLQLPDSVEVRVHDSTSDVRWMVLPYRPEGTDGWSEEQLARLVTIDSLVGTAPALNPAAVAQSKG
jgi:nitrile hydratase subunit alpha